MKKNGTKYRCADCTRSFGRPAALGAHRRWQHSRTPHPLRLRRLGHTTPMRQGTVAAKLEGLLREVKALERPAPTADLTKELVRTSATMLMLARKLERAVR